MKKNQQCKKLLLKKIMKFTFLQMCLSILATGMVLAGNVNGQNLLDKEITVEFENTKLKDVLPAIEQLAEVAFVYSSKAIKAKNRITIKVEKQKLSDFLDEVLPPLNIVYKELNGQILLRAGDRPKVISSKKEKISESKKTETKVQDEVELLVEISGTVSDDRGETLIGATIVEKGTTNGTTTDIDGSFKINLKGDNPTLVISYTGYEPKEVIVGSQTTFNIVLSESSNDLEEVVVIGYGSVVKKDVTGAVATIKAGEFNAGEITSPELLIQGKSPGIQISSDGGEPGGNVNVRIRGTSSVRSGNGPLYVVNGFPLSGSAISPSGANVGGNDAGAGNTTPKNPLAFINPADIESIDILKDASATAIYGSRGANGVILITTKPGRSGKSALTYNTSISSSQITKKLPLLSAEEFVAAGGPDLGSPTDWQDQIYRTALATNHHFGFGGGTKDGSSVYALSFGARDQDGIVLGSGTKVYTGTINTTYKMFDDKLKINAFAAGSNILDENPQISNDAGVPGDLLGATWRANPTQPIKDADGNFTQVGVSDLNPAAILAFSTDKTNTFRILANVSAQYSFTDNFSYKFNFGVDRSDSERRSAVSRDLIAAISSQNGIATVASAFNSNKLLEHSLNYNADVGSNNRFSALVGYSYQSFASESSAFTVRNFQVSDLDVMLNNLGSATTAIGQAGEAISFAGKDELQSFFGRVNYSIDDKYLLTGTLRADGSSKFGENNRYGYFPSAAFAWRLSQEDFIPASINDLKFRLGWGITGNQEFPGGSHLSIQRYDRTNSLSAPRFANPNLKWESTSQLNAGIDFVFLNWKFRGSVDVYSKKTTDLLLQLDSALPAPAPFFFGNLDAEVVNRGLELGLEYDVISKEDFTWTSAFNIGLNKNEVTKIDRTIQTGAISGPGLTGAFAQVIMEGQPLYAYFMGEFSGFDDNGLSVESAPALLGKSPLPDYTFGFSNYVSFKEWDFNVFFSGQVGNYIYNNNANARFFAAALSGGSNVTRDVVNTNESIGNGNGVSTRFLEDGSFIRLQNMSLAYNLSGDKINFIQNARFSITGQNLFTITDYSGQDPEVNVDKSIGGVPSFGIDYSAYPRARTVVLGLQITF